MTPRIDVSVISDVSANIFAAFILILIILLANSRAAGPAGQPAPASIDAARDLHVVERAPVRASDMVEMLRGRSGGGALNVDLFDGRIELTGAGWASPVILDPRRDGERTMLDRLDGLLRGQAAGTPVRLFVFSNRWYALVTGRLAAAGVSWQEISVPQALRAPLGPRGGDAWSGAFLDLVLRNLDRDRFRLALSRLLAGTAEAADQLGRSFGAPLAGSPAVPAGAPELSLLDRIKHFLGVLAAVTAMILAIGAIVLVERRYPRSIHL